MQATIHCVQSCVMWHSPTRSYRGQLPLRMNTCSVLCMRGDLAGEYLQDVAMVDIAQNESPKLSIEEKLQLLRARFGNHHCASYCREISATVLPHSAAADA